MTDPLVEVPEGAVARVAVEQSLPHLDQLFDYAIPPAMREAVVPGCRVKIRFSGQLRDGYVVEVATSSAFERELASLHKVVSSEPVLTASTYRLLRAVADHYAGVWWDVARLAIPPRHAATENANQRVWPTPSPPALGEVIARYPTGEAFLAALRTGGTPRATWQAAPHARRDEALFGAIEAAAATLDSGRGVIVVVPTARELERILPVIREAFGAQAVATLSAEQGRSSRYRNYLALTRGEARIVVGTRGAVFAPVHNLGLTIVLDEGNDLLAEQRAPYFHARTVAVLRASLEQTALLLVSHARSVDAEALLERRWLRELRLLPTELRRLVAPVQTVSVVDRQRDPAAARLRIPSKAFAFLRTQLTEGPVLVQVPARGYAASMACQRCHDLARCTRCGGRLRARRPGEPECSLCGFAPLKWRCRVCQGMVLQTPRPGEARTAQELARAFPGVLAVNSSADRLRECVPDEPGIVVATPGAEPRTAIGYAGLLILDADATLARADARATEEAVRRWSNALALVRPAADGGRVLIVGGEDQPAVQAMARCDVVGLASRELALRAETRLAPTVRMARVMGEHAAVAAFLNTVQWDMVEVLGPTEVAQDRWAALLRAELGDGREFVRLVKQALAIRSAKKQGGVLHVVVDPEVMV